MSALQPLLGPTQDRRSLYLRYRVERGIAERKGPHWSEDPRRAPRLAKELQVIEKAGFESYFLILARIMQFCRDRRIPYGPGRGSVGGSYVAYALGVHEIDSLEWGLIFERFMNEDRVAYPDVDLDVSQRRREEVLQFIRNEFEDEHTAVLQVAAFARAGARRTIDMVALAKQQQDPRAMAIATDLKKLLPEGANVTGGTKQEYELRFWLDSERSSTKARERFREIAEGAGWMELLLKLDGIQTHLAKHAAGVVILSREDLKRLPQTSADGQTMMTGYDMYSLEALDYLKIDLLGLRTLDIVADAHRACGGSGGTPELMELWQQRREDPEPYRLLSDADALGVFQVETSGYRKTLRAFQPKHFDHIVQLNALYRPGALDAQHEDGRNMVEVFIDRLHGREPISYPPELREPLAAELNQTQGILLYQEQFMALARTLAGFSDKQADNLRKAIGKKQAKRMAEVIEGFSDGMRANGYSDNAIGIVMNMIEASQRYSWNKSHAVFYACLAENSLIQTARGSQYIQDVVPGDRVVSASDSRGLVWHGVSDVYANGIKDGYCVILEDGIEITGTADHRLLTEQGYKRIDEVGPGDALKVSYDFSPVPGVTCFAAAMTSMTEGNQVPGWIVLYDTERDDVVHWQFHPLDTANDTPSVTISDVVFESRCPRINGVGTMSSASQPAPILAHTTLLTRLDAIALYSWADDPRRRQRFSRVLERKSELRRHILSGQVALQVPSDHGVEMVCDTANVRAGACATISFDESAERARGASQPKLSQDFVVRAASAVEIQDLLPSLSQILIPGIVSLDKNTPSGASAAASAGGRSSLGHAVNIPHSRRVADVMAAGRMRVYDLEMEGTPHNFSANGVIAHNCITWWTAFYKATEKAAFYMALINSLEEDKDRQAEAVAEARQHVTIRPPDVNLAQSGYTVADGAIVFGLNGIKGMGEANRDAILLERLLCGPFRSFQDFQERLPSVPINMKLSLVRCGAFDQLEPRERLLARVPKPNGELWTVAEHIKHNASLKKPRELPPVMDWDLPTDRELSDGEIATIGFYVSKDPMADVSRTLAKLEPGRHWGGQVEEVKLKTDKRGSEYARFTLLTAALTKQRCMVFGSNWPQCRQLVRKGERLIVRGYLDGSQLMVEAVFRPDDFRHFRRLVLERDGHRTAQDYDGQPETIETAQAAGYRVTLL